MNIVQKINQFYNNKKVIEDEIERIFNIGNIRYYDIKEFELEYGRNEEAIKVKYKESITDKCYSYVILPEFLFTASDKAIEVYFKL